MFNVYFSDHACVHVVMVSFDSARTASYVRRGCSRGHLSTSLEAANE